MVLAHLSQAGQWPLGFPILADNVHFITFVFHDSFPKLDGTLSPLSGWDMLTRAQGRHVSVETTANQ